MKIYVYLGVLDRMAVEVQAHSYARLEVVQSA